MFNAGLNVEGINAEVAAGMGVSNIFKGAKMLEIKYGFLVIWLKKCEKYGLSIEWHPKPSELLTGMVQECMQTFQIIHCELVVTKNFNQVCEAFGKNIKKHMDVYGAHNEQRLTGLHETQSIHEFSYGF